MTAKKKARKSRKMTKAELATVRRISQSIAYQFAGMVAERIVALGPSLDTEQIAQIAHPLGLRMKFTMEEVPTPTRKGRR